MARKKKDEIDNKRTVFVIQPPHSDTKYVLLVTRSGSMMGTQTAAFGVDRLITDTTPDGHTALTVRGIVDNPHEIVVEFPVGTAYLLVRRSDMRMMTQLELLTEQRDEEKEIEAIFAPATVADIEKTIDLADRAHGQYL